MVNGIVKKSIESLDRKIFRSPFTGFLISLCFTVYFITFQRYSIWIQILPFLVLCVLILICMLYFLWQEAGSRGYLNLPQIHLRIAVLPLRKYMIFLALVIVPFLVITYSIKKYSEIKERPQKEVQQITKIKKGQKMKRKKNFVHLTKFNEKELFENISEFRGYIVNRKRGVKLNPDKLVNLLYVYFRSVLLYPSPVKR